MSGVIAAAAGVMQFARHEDTAIHIWPLLASFLFIVLPVMATVASVAILFEVVPMLRGGLGNVIYFFLWIFACAAMAGLPAEGVAWLRGADLTIDFLRGSTFTTLLWPLTGQHRHRFRNTTTASGGSVTAMLNGRLCFGIGREDTSPPFPKLLPPNNSESVFRISS